MNRALCVVLAPIFVLAAACGGDSGADKEAAAEKKAEAEEAASAAASASAEAAKTAVCDRIGREWAVKAKDVNRKLALGLSGDMQDLLDELSGFVDQMEVEQCPDSVGTVRNYAALANYEASLVNAELIGCGMDLDCSLKVAGKWVRKGAPFVIQVQRLVGIDPGIN